jgi:hypothetical protein
MTIWGPRQANRSIPWDIDCGTPQIVRAGGLHAPDVDIDAEDYIERCTIAAAQQVWVWKKVVTRNWCVAARWTARFCGG